MALGVRVVVVGGGGKVRNRQVVDQLAQRVGASGGGARQHATVRHVVEVAERKSHSSVDEVAL